MPNTPKYLPRFVVAAAAAAAFGGFGLLAPTASADPTPGCDPGVAGCVGTGPGSASAEAPNSGVAADRDGASATAPGTGVTADHGGASVYVPGGSASADHGGANFCVPGFCANAG